MTTFHCEQAWLGGDTAAKGVLIETSDGVIKAVAAGVPALDGSVILRGLTLPGLANTHSHVFHRAIRGHSQSGVADFWRWRDLMYSVAARLTPELMYDLARATYAEMALSGITSVGEFHYVHHQAGGASYADPNEMGRAVIRAANDAGIRITLIDTCYLQADVRGGPLTGVQQRFGDGSWQAWATRVDELGNGPKARTGAAIHSVRAVPRSAMGPVARTARERGWPLHLHLSEQPAENEAALDAYGLTPAAVLAAEGVLAPNTTAVHATHLTEDDIDLLGDSGTFISMCCSTEHDLADGIGPAVQLRLAGSPLCVGSDAHMRIDLWEEGRAIELDQRLVSGRRGHLSARQLARALTTDGATAIGWPEAGTLAPGSLADFVTVRLDSPRTAGARSGDALAHVLFAASGADVTEVYVAGEAVVRDGRHLSVDVGRELETAVAAALTGP
ncbi:formimidoylglutamate deiminase [Leekyejoonella antrihumi]|uniref:Formimidoylglutamate deiminase n=1 Tax=Leekyejoonella antrihumi TaxID=1660198 RepID=A0A563E060_9MICO|nr:formimidoylglutamate deiminase [Leekyejoonella antrihumi]TWP35775.1 formimidoylglutamate deiminase [Leekyejoonella antrihumi]